MLKRLANHIIDTIISRVLLFDFDVEKLDSNKYEITLYYDNNVVWRKIINLKLPNRKKFEQPKHINRNTIL